MTTNLNKDIKNRRDKEWDSALCKIIHYKIKHNKPYLTNQELQDIILEKV